MPTTNHLHARSALTFAAALALLAGTAAAQEVKIESTSTAAAAPTGTTDDVPVLDASSPWSLRVRAMAWYVSTGGDLKLPSETDTPSSTVELESLDADEPVFAPMADFTFRRGDWGLTVRGAGWSTSGTAQPGFTGRLGDVEFSPTTTLDSEVQILMFEAEGLYTLGRYQPERSEFKIDGALDLVFGGRLTSVDASTRDITPGIGSAVPPESSEDNLFIEPLVGLRGSMEIAEQVDLEVQCTIGGLPLGDTSSFTGDIIAGISWRPIENVGILFGYRSIFLDVSDGEDNGEFALSGPATAQGLFFGAVVAF
jgi:hypothetical protein